MKRTLHPIIAIVLAGMLFSCGGSSEKSTGDEEGQTLTFDWQGHRGARGELPENSLRAMQRALYNKMKTLEMDVVITADSAVVLSHEPYMSHEICLDTAGQPFAEVQAVQYNIYKMTLAEVQQFDCGSKTHSRFPNQEHFVTRKPTLQSVFAAAEQLALQINRPAPYYNIEIKSRPEWDGLYHPEVPVYVDLVMKIAMEAGLEERIILQSFDPRALRYAHEHYPEITLAYLTDRREPALAAQIENLGFTPAILSCNHQLVDQSMIEFAQRQNMKVIPWTVNDMQRAEELIQKYQVDGLITDFPSRMKQVRMRNGK